MVEIVDMPGGERMRLTLERPAQGLEAIVVIDRSGGPEILPLTPIPGDNLRFESAVAPSEPHAFSANLKLKVGGTAISLAFKMAEQDDHHH